MNTIVFTHHKGGTGKTTACINVAGWLAKLGNRVLVIDLDPQGNATTGLGVDRETSEISSYDILTGKTGIKKSILVTESGVHLVPAMSSFRYAEQIFDEDRIPATVLKRKLKNIQQYYDYVCIDTPPADTSFMVNGIVAADKIIIPLDSGVFAVETMETMRALLEKINEEFGSVEVHQFLLLENPSAGGLFSWFNKNPTDEIAETLGEYLETHCEESPSVTKIPFSRTVYDAHKRGMPLSHHAPSSKVGKAYRKIAEKIIKEPKKKKARKTFKTKKTKSRKKRKTIKQ